LIVRVIAQLSAASDQALAILAVAYLDHLLRLLIVSALGLDRFPEAAEEFLFEGRDTGLATFYSRIEMAKSLGEISDDEARDLNLIRKVRNEFAHALGDLSFDAHDISSRCRELRAGQATGAAESPRACYQTASVRLMVGILQRTHALTSQNDTESERRVLE
jgi:hypothetical protein